MAGLIKRLKAGLGIVGGLLIFIVALAVLSGFGTLIRETLFWLPAKFLGGLLCFAALLGIIILLTAPVTQFSSSREFISKVWDWCSTGIAVTSCFLFVVLTDATLSESAARTALNTIVGVPFAGLIGAIKDGRWIAIAVLSVLIFIAWYANTAARTLRHGVAASLPARIGGFLFFSATVGLIVLQLSQPVPSTRYAINAESARPVPTSPPNSTMRRLNSLHIRAREALLLVKLDFLKYTHSEAIVAIRRHYEFLQDHGLVSSSLSYIQKAEERSSHKYGKASPETLRHVIAKATTLSALGHPLDAQLTLNDAEQHLGSQAVENAHLRCDFRLAAASILADSTDPQQAIQQIEDVFNDPGCVSIQAMQDQLPAMITYARALTAMGRSHDAKPIVVQALKESQNHVSPESPLVIQLLLTASDIFAKTGDGENALRLADQAWNLLSSGVRKDHPILAFADFRIGSALLTAGEPESAIEPLRLALESFKSTLGTESQAAMSATLELGRAYRRAGRSEEAKELHGSLRERASRAGHPLRTIYLKASAELIADLYTLGEHAAVNAIGKPLLDQWPSLTDQAVPVLIEREAAIQTAKYVAMSRVWENDIVGGFLLAETSKRLPSLSNSQPENSGDSAELAQRLGKLEEDIARSYRFPGLRIKLERKRADLLDRFSRMPVVDRPGLTTGSPPFQVPELRRLLEQDELYVSFITTPDDIGIVFVLSHDDLRAYEVYPQLFELELFLGHLGVRAIQSDTPTYDDEFLTDSLFPFLRESSLEETRSIVISPDAWMSQVPFDALRLDGRYLSESVEVSLTASAQSLITARERHKPFSPNSRLLIIGNPNYENSEAKRNVSVAQTHSTLTDLYRSQTLMSATQRRSWPKLPGSSKEIEGVSRLWETDNIKVIQGDMATKSNVQDAFAEPGENGDYILFSSHGFSNTIEPDLSALVLAPSSNSPAPVSYLTAAEIANLDIQAQLAVLSACETAAAGSEVGSGLLGLPSAFSRAGVNQIIVTLWSIEDGATADLTVGFFEKVVRGMSYKSALAMTKREIISTPGYEHPRYWAAFVLFGALEG